jgi:hypothetical protein
MNIQGCCARLFAACGGGTLASWLRGKSRNENKAPTAELRDWENEGGNLEPSPEASDFRVTTGSA